MWGAGHFRRSVTRKVRLIRPNVRTINHRRALTCLRGHVCEILSTNSPKRREQMKQTWKHPENVGHIMAGNPKKPVKPSRGNITNTTVSLSCVCQHLCRNWLSNI